MDGINGQIGGDNKAPLLIIDDGEEAAPALTAMEVPAAADAAPAPAFVESLEDAEPAVPPVAVAPEPAAPAAPAAPAHKKAAPVAAKAPLPMLRSRSHLKRRWRQRQSRAGQSAIFAL
jgi:hypothetical protein